MSKASEKFNELWEMRFIDSLFTKQILEGYLSGCEKRVNWDGMNKNVIINYARNRLQRIGGNFNGRPRVR